MKNIPFIFAVPVGAILSVACISMWQQISRLKAELVDLRADISWQEDADESELERLTKVRLQYQSNNKRGRQNDNCMQDSKDSTEGFLRDVAQEQVNETVLTKYELMLSALELGAREEQELVELLAKRESLVNIVSHSYFTEPMDSEVVMFERDDKLSEIDAQVEDILDPDQRDKYQLLKDSGFEQFQIREFDDSLDSSEILTSQQSNNLLLAKLRPKEEYLRAIADATRLINMGEQETGLKSYEKAIESYQSQYLDAARDELTDSQFNKLKTVESKSFEDMLYSLRAPYEDRDWEDD